MQFHRVCVFFKHRVLFNLWRCLILMQLYLCCCQAWLRAPSTGSRLMTSPSPRAVSTWREGSLWPPSPPSPAPPLHAPSQPAPPTSSSVPRTTTERLCAFHARLSVTPTWTAREDRTKQTVVSEGYKMCLKWPPVLLNPCFGSSMTFFSRGIHWPMVPNKTLWLVIGASLEWLKTYLLFKCYDL